VFEILLPHIVVILQKFDIKIPAITGKKPRAENLAISKSYLNFYQILHLGKMSELSLNITLPQHSEICSTGIDLLPADEYNTSSRSDFHIRFPCSHQSKKHQDERTGF
jgi:hypothetical protein